MGNITLPGLTIKPDYPPIGSTYQGVTRYSKAKVKPFEAIVVHHTAGGSYNGAKDAAFNGIRTTSKGTKFLAGYHFIVDKDGTIYQMAPENIRTNHTRSDLGDPFTNSKSIGVSLVGYGNKPFEGAQREQALKLISGLMDKYDIPIGNIKGHAETQKGKEKHEGMWIHDAIKNGELTEEGVAVGDLEDPADTKSSTSSSSSSSSSSSTSSSTGTSQRSRSDGSSTQSLGAGGNVMSFAANQFINRAPDQALAQIEGALGPGLSFLASDVLTSLQTGSGIQSLNDLVSGLTSQDTVTGRITSLGNFAAENQQLVGAVAPEAMSLLPTLPLLTEILDASPRDRARLVLENKDVLGEMVGMEIPSSVNLLGNDIDLLEAMNPQGELVAGLEEIVARIDEAREQRNIIDTSRYNDKDGLPVEQNKGIFGKGLGLLGKIPGVGGVLDDVGGYVEDKTRKVQDLIMGERMYDPAVAVLEFVKSDDPQIQKEALEKLKNLGIDLPDEIDLLSVTPKEFIELPEVKSKLGDAYNLINPESDQVDIETMISKYISEQSGISTSSAKTLAFGGGEEAAKKLKSEVGSVAFEGLVDSFPILGEIIEFFINNKGILTALAVAGGASAVGGLLGGGFLGNAVAGAGTMAALRLGLGEEGYNKFQGLVGEGASKAIGIFREAFKSSGLADNEFLGPAIEGMLNFGEENPVASLLGVTGNIGGALGAFAGTKAIDIIDNTSSTDEVLKYLQDTVPMGSQMNNILDSINMTFNASSQADPNQVGGVQGTQEQTNTGPNSKELSGVTGSGWRPVNYDNVNADYAWPPINT